ncbi:uncharacterized protein F4812DRAFT_414953 [Daldinia caldariorum]|uniref:uncharacterized protein n=1 Tax=Daldinia caldariorum TaxID=326644 RepID=UPI0020076753|nr:uncharacterized protein F4812DRAFT_414953 [Daldinia caldariorum]KAI1471639.1 hypothetical protein F4812DRAFT_414953 [Daldinia caldariorum]
MGCLSRALSAVRGPRPCGLYLAAGLVLPCAVVSCLVPPSKRDPAHSKLNKRFSIITRTMQRSYARSIPFQAPKAAARPMGRAVRVNELILY